MKNTDDEPRRLSFKDFTVVDYVPGEGQYINYQAQKRHRGTVGEEVEQIDEKVRPLEMTQAKYDSYPKNKKGKSGGKLYIIQNQKSGVTKGGVKFTSLGGGAGTTKVPVKIVKELPYKYEESVEQTDEMSNRLLNRYSDAAKKDTKKDRAKGMRKARNIRTQRANKGLWGSDIGEEVEQTDEAYTVAQRIKAKQRMKKMSKRIQMAKKRAMKRAPSTEKLKLRARKQAKGALVAKWSKGKQKGELSFAQRQNIEKRLKSASGRIDTMSKRLLPDVRKQDRERRSNAKNKSEEK